MSPILSFVLAFISNNLSLNFFVFNKLNFNPFFFFFTYIMQISYYNKHFSFSNSHLINFMNFIVNLLETMFGSQL